GCRGVCDKAVAFANNGSEVYFLFAAEKQCSVGCNKISCIEAGVGGGEDSARSCGDVKLVKPEHCFLLLQIGTHCVFGGRQLRGVSYVLVSHLCKQRDLVCVVGVLLGRLPSEFICLQNDVGSGFVPFKECRNIRWHAVGDGIKARYKLFAVCV